MERYRVGPGEKIRLKDFDPGDISKYDGARAGKTRSACAHRDRSGSGWGTRTCGWRTREVEVSGGRNERRSADATARGRSARGREYSLDTPAPANDNRTIPPGTRFAARPHPASIDALKLNVSN